MSEVWCCRQVAKQENKCVTYYRVSTERQGRSGLGLEAQRAAVEAFMHTDGPRSELASFTEIENGKHADRPELVKALLRCRQTRATLLAAKLDRLSRDSRHPDTARLDVDRNRRVSRASQARGLTRSPARRLSRRNLKRGGEPY
jgi:DNA invertase Pin-like site-specific DNA recombinase